MLDEIRAEGGLAYKVFADAGELRELLLNDLATMLTERFSRTSMEPPALHPFPRVGPHPGRRWQAGRNLRRRQRDGRGRPNRGNARELVRRLCAHARIRHPRAGPGTSDGSLICRARRVLPRIARRACLAAEDTRDD